MVCLNWRYLSWSSWNPLETAPWAWSMTGNVVLLAVISEPTSWCSLGSRLLEASEHGYTSRIAIFSKCCTNHTVVTLFEHQLTSCSGACSVKAADASCSQLNWATTPDFPARPLATTNPYDILGWILSQEDEQMTLPKPTMIRNTRSNTMQDFIISLHHQRSIQNLRCFARSQQWWNSKSLFRQGNANFDINTV